MQKLNLVNKKAGSIDYEVYTFPDGEKQLNILSELDHKELVLIVCRITNGDDLFLLLQAADILTAHGMDFNINILYLMSARTDRRFTMNRPLSYKIVCDILNTIKCYKYVLDVHNPCKGYLENTVIYSRNTAEIRYDMLCFPDTGAKKRYQSNDALCCEKVRDSEGNLSGFTVINPEDFKGGSILVKDDLCDGGGTFVGIAKELRKLNPTSIMLQVTHAIQTEGLRKTSEVYDKVYITNSYPVDCDFSNVIIEDVTSGESFLETV